MAWDPTAMLPELPICKSLKLCASLLLAEKSCLYKDPEKFKRCILPVTQLQQMLFKMAAELLFAMLQLVKTWSICRLASCKRASSAVPGVLTRSSWLSALGPTN